MVATSIPDPAAPVRYALTHRPAKDDRVDIVLDLFRGTVPVHSRTIAQVQRVQAVLVMVKCRRYLDLRGVVPAGPVAPPAVAPAKAEFTPARPVAPRLPTRAAVAPATPAAAPTPTRAAGISAKPTSAPIATRAAVVPVKPAAAPARPAAMPVRPAALAVKPRHDRAAEPRSAAPVAAFDWMFQAG